MTEKQSTETPDQYMQLDRASHGPVRRLGIGWSSLVVRVGIKNQELVRAGVNNQKLEPKVKLGVRNQIPELRVKPEQGGVARQDQSQQ